MSGPDAERREPVPYATPVARRADGGAFGAAVLMVGGLGLIFLGGPILLGSRTAELTGASRGHILVCYAMVAVCTLGAICLIALGVRKAMAA